MKKLLTLLFIMIFASNLSAIANVTDENVEYDADYYRRQIIIEEKYSKMNFFIAIMDGDTKKIEAYVKSGMHPDTAKQKVPAIFFAIAAKQPSSVETLIKNGANPNLTVFSTTPILFAVNKKQFDCVKALVENNADVNAQPNGLSPLYEAIASNQYDVAQYLLNAGAEVNDKIIIKAVKSNNETVKNLVLQKAAQSMQTAN